MIKKEFATREEMCLAAFGGIKEAIGKTRPVEADEEAWVRFLIHALGEAMWQPVLYIIGESSMDVYYSAQDSEKNLIARANADRMAKHEANKDEDKKWLEGLLSKNEAAKAAGDDPVYRFFVFSPAGCWTDDGTPIEPDERKGFVIAKDVSEEYVRNFFPRVFEE